MADTGIPSVPSGAALSGRGIARAAMFVMLGFVLSRALALAREVILAARFGAGADYEAYLVALRLPDTIFFVVAGGALGSAFIPAFTALLARGDRAGAWRLASAVTTLITLILIGLAGLGAIFAGVVVSGVLAPGFPADQAATAARLLRIMLISPVIFGVSGLVMGQLNAHGRFLLPAIAPALYNAGIIFGAVALAPKMGIDGLAWGVVIGAAAHLAAQLPGLAALRPDLRPLFDLADAGVREVARLMAPRVLGLAIVQVNFWVNTALASGMVTGSIAALSRGWIVMLLPQGVIAQSVATAVFPTFSAQAARGEHEALSRTLGQVLRAVLFLSLPAAVGLILLRAPLIRLMFERGDFTPADSAAAAWALLFFALGLVSHSLLEIVTRAFYALHDTRTPVVVGGGAMILNVAFSLLLIRVIGDPDSLVTGPFAGLALANTLATTLEALTLLILIRVRVGGMGGRALAIGGLRAALASAVMGGALIMLMPLIDQVGLLVGTLGLIALGGVIYGGAAWLAGSEEARLFGQAVLRRVRPSGDNQQIK